LFFKFVAVLAILGIAVVTYAAVETWVFYQDRKTSIIRIEQAQAEHAADKINDFVKDIEAQLAWTTHRPWTMTASDPRRLVLWRLLLHQVPAITDVALLDASGHEELRVSRLGLDVVGSGDDFSADPKFVEAVAHKVYYGPVYFREKSEPYMSLALAGVGPKPTVSVAEVNLKFIWDTISQIKVGETGNAYVVDQQGRLIAHSDISLVLREIDLSHLAQVHAAPTRPGAAMLWHPDQVFTDIRGRSVLAAYSPVGAFDWRVFVELPTNEAFAPLYASIIRAIVLITLGLIVAFLVGVFLTRKIVRPLERLEEFATTVRRTRDYNLRFSSTVGDEVGRLASGFNDMLAELAAVRDREIADQIERARSERLTTLGTMTASIAHEIRQPLSGMLLSSNAGLRWLAQTPPNIDQARVALTRIATAGHRAGQVIETIRALFKNDANERISVEINQLVIEALDLARSAVQANRISIAMELRDGLPRLLADRIQLQQVLLNLITNAIESMSLVTDRERILRIKTDYDESGVLITVEDSGTGVDPEYMNRLFGAFFTTKPHGMGMGLAICRAIVAAHGGRLTASPGKPHGSIFQVVLPTDETDTGTVTVDMGAPISPVPTVEDDLTPTQVS
jgi:signal transduction histidine kinase